MNAARNGSKLNRLVLGDLPKTMHRQLQVIRKYRRRLEAAVMESKGEVNLTDSHLINEAATAEQHACICRWLMRTKLDTMTVSDITKCSSEILKAKTVRNRAVERLQIDRDTMRDNAIESLYTTAVTINEVDTGGDSE